MNKIKVIEFQTNNTCNGKFSICPHSKLYKEQIEMPLEKIHKIVKYAKDNNVDLLVPYLNNEPFLDKRMISILRYIKDFKIDVEISSNISALSYDNIDIIFEENLIKDFRISFFGGSKKTYSKLMPNLDYEKNLKKLKYIFSKYGQANNPTVCMVLVDDIDIDYEYNILKQYIPNINVRFFGYMDRFGNNDKKNNLVIDNHNYFNYKVIGCCMGRPEERLCIYSDGSVVTCSQDWNKSIVYGNIENLSIEDIINSNKRKENLDKISGNIKMESTHICRKCKEARIVSVNENKITKNFKGDLYINENGEKKIEI